MELERKTRALLEIIPPVPPRGRLLVVGCGSGGEAGVIARARSLQVLGIDVSSADFGRQKAAPAELALMDARRLSVGDASFDFVYSFHALEHILPPEHALREMSRVLVGGGGFLIGTPNRSRIVGYVGAPATLTEKMRWNLADWNCRIRGQFRNELGAHAGFSEGELRALCTATLGPSVPVTISYYRALYPRHGRLISVLCRAGLASLVLPSVYVVGTKPRDGTDPRGGHPGTVREGLRGRA